MRVKAYLTLSIQKIKQEKNPDKEKRLSQFTFPRNNESEMLKAHFDLLFLLYFSSR